MQNANNAVNAGAVFTMKFKDYAAANAFVTKSGAMLAGARPYKRTMWIDGCQVSIWCVTMTAPKSAA